MSINKLIQVFREDFDIRADIEINSHSKFREIISWSSMNALVVIILIENEYDVIVEDEVLKSLNTFEELYELVVRKKEKSE
jgi:acyl carrier protein